MRRLDLLIPFPEAALCLLLADACSPTPSDACCGRSVRPRVPSTFNVAQEVRQLSSGVFGRDIHIPSTSIPLCIARTPNGISLTLGMRMPHRCISDRRACFSSSRSSYRRRSRLDSQSLMKPMANTMAIRQAKTWYTELMTRHAACRDWVRHLQKSCPARAPSQGKRFPY